MHMGMADRLAVIGADVHADVEPGRVGRGGELVTDGPHQVEDRRLLVIGEAEEVRFVTSRHEPVRAGSAGIVYRWGWVREVTYPKSRRPGCETGHAGIRDVPDCPPGLTDVHHRQNRPSGIGPMAEGTIRDARCADCRRTGDRILNAVHSDGAIAHPDS